MKEDAPMCHAQFAARIATERCDATIVGVKMFTRRAAGVFVTTPKYNQRKNVLQQRLDEMSGRE